MRVGNWGSSELRATGEPPLLRLASLVGLSMGGLSLLFGLVICALGLAFGLTIYSQLKNMPVHSSMLEVSELIYETCKTYLWTQIKFIIVLEIFIGTVERTYRAAIRVDGSLPHFRISADLGYHRIMNHNHVEGQTLSRFEGRLLITAGLVKRGTLQ